MTSFMAALPFNADGRDCSIAGEVSGRYSERPFPADARRGERRGCTAQVPFAERVRPFAAAEARLGLPSFVSPRRVGVRVIAPLTAGRSCGADLEEELARDG